MTANLQQACSQLSDHANRLRLRDTALSNGMKWTVKSGSLPGGIAAADIQLRFRSVSLCIDHAMTPTPYFDVACDIVAHGKLIGRYRLIADISGTPDDDYWIIDT